MDMGEKARKLSGMTELLMELRFRYESTRGLLAFFFCYGCDLGYGCERERG